MPHVVKLIVHYWQPGLLSLFAVTTSSTLTAHNTLEYVVACKDKWIVIIGDTTYQSCNPLPRGLSMLRVVQGGVEIWREGDEKPTFVMLGQETPIEDDYFY